MTQAGPVRARITFHGDLLFFLKAPAAGRIQHRIISNPAAHQTIERTLFEPTSVKDAIEACGVPHPEIDVVNVNGKAADFSFVLRENCVIDVYPVDFTPANPERVHLQRRDQTRFVADGHLGKLASNLRLLGFDTRYDNAADDRQLLEIMQGDRRTLLTRDRRLLMHAIVTDGYCPRTDDPAQQTAEVIRRFELTGKAQPFTRCLQCNSLLHHVEKSEVLHQLEPLTRIYYEQFRRCSGCGKVYWRGSHFAKLQAALQQLGLDLPAHWQKIDEGKDID